MKKGLVCSAFDLLHAGHTLMLKDARAHCEHLIAGLQVDPSVTDASYRGKKKSTPILSLEERLTILQGIKYIDEIFIYTDEPELRRIIEKIGPHIRILGSDWRGKYATGQEIASEVYYHERTHDYSTTSIKERIRKNIETLDI